MKDKDLVPLMITRLASQLLVLATIIVSMLNVVDAYEGLSEFNYTFADKHNWVLDPNYTGCVIVAVLAMCGIEFIYNILVIDLLEAQEMLA